MNKKEKGREKKNKDKGVSISGKVIHGLGYGRVLGFPTANLDRRGYARKKMKVRTGVWGGYTKVMSRVYKSAITISPLDKHRLPKIESYLIGFKGNLYGKKIEIFPLIFLRGWIYFKSEQALKVKIGLDVRAIKKMSLIHE